MSQGQRYKPKLDGASLRCSRHISSGCVTAVSGSGPRSPRVKSDPPRGGRAHRAGAAFHSATSALKTDKADGNTEERQQPCENQPSQTRLVVRRKTQRCQRTWSPHRTRLVLCPRTHQRRCVVTDQNLERQKAGKAHRTTLWLLLKLRPENDAHAGTCLISALS